ncbi:hypothetical protein CsSME_00027251 [Camellia sinensis var. sinensis]
MVYLDMKIEIERGLQWKGRNKRIERLMSRSVSNKESGGPSDHSLGSKLKQPMHSGVIVEDRVEDQSMDLELYWAATKNNVDAFIDVLEQVSVSPMGNTLLHIAASFGNEETWEPRLIRLVDEEGSTPLHLAAYLGYLEEVQYLLGRESSLAVARDNNGLFPIHLASIKGHVDVVRALLQCWPDSRELLNCHGQNILHVAAKSGGHNMVSYILQTPELEKLINMRDKHGNTPLHLATMDWHPKIVNLLTWDRRMDLKVLSNEGMTALDSAEHYMERMPSFRKLNFVVQRLTWTALKAAGAPRAYCRKAINAKKKERLASMQLEQLSIDNYKDRVNTLLLVSTLVATVTFAAGLTMPGGYNNNSDHDQGMATMLKHKWFHMFIFCDTIAMYSSIIVSVSLIWAQLGDLNLVLTAFRLALPLLGIALTMMSLAFVAGVYVVVSVLNWLAHAVLIMGMVFLTILIVLFIPLCIPVSSNYPILRYVFYYPFCLLIFVTRSYTQDDLVEYKSLWWML